MYIHGLSYVGLLLMCTEYTGYTRFVVFSFFVNFVVNYICIEYTKLLKVINVRITLRYVSISY